MRKIFLSVILIPLFLSCSTDFDVNADWQDITIVYSLLSQKDSVHYVKVNKAFLGERDAYEMALQSDSINYNSDISVKLERWKNNETQASQIIYLEKTNDIIKDSLDIYGNTGSFATDNNIIYKTTDSLFSDSDYKLVVEVPNKKEIVTSTTGLISDFRISLPTADRPPAISLSDYKNNFKVEWFSAINGRLYQMTIRFNYLEIENKDTVKNFIDWKFPSQLSQNLRIKNNLAEKMFQYVNGESFFEFVSLNIDENSNVIRVAQNLDFIFNVAGEELANYIQISQPSNSISETNPEYTNITNGKGIFSCRYTKTVFDKKLTSQTIDSLAYGKYTKNLRFLNHNNGL
ncbi:MAG: hypothetical protein DRJ01_13720 [Bacteroidetes bacterium]|nr:MAG: hypothetical protein DRJ01_13720 [Bacteroidota bacterium]